MTKANGLKNIMFMKINEKRYQGAEAKPERHGGRAVAKIPKPKPINETEGYRIITDLFRRNDAKAIVKMGSSADVLGMSPLALASSVGHKDAVVCLLNVNYNVNRQSPDGNYPLIQAVRGKFLEIVELLLKKGAMVTLQNYEGDNTFMIAIVTGDANIINKVWPYRGDLDINQANKYGTTALHLATEKKWEGCVEFLLLNGADVNRRNANGCTALFIAVVTGDMKLTEKLVAQGTDILIEDNDGFSAICRGIEAEKEDIVKYLMTKLSNAQKEFYAKGRIDKLRALTMEELDSHCNEEHDAFFETLFTMFQSDIFKDTLYRIKAIPNVLNTSRQYTAEADIMSTMFFLCSMLMTDFGTIIDERFTLQFIRSQGHDLVMKTIKQNPDIEKLEQRQENETDIIAGMLLPLICMHGLEEGRDWLQKNLSNLHLVKMTDYLRSGSTIENFFNCAKCPPRFKKAWNSYLEFFDNMVMDRRVENQTHLLMNEEKDKQKAKKKRDRKRLRRQKQREAKEENVNKNANGKLSDEEINKAVGAEKSSKRTDENVRYDQHVLMPDWNVCIENVRESDGNIIQTRHDPMQFRYNYVEPTHAKKSNGYHMHQTAPPLRTNKDDKTEWQKVENRRVAAAKTAASKHAQRNQNVQPSRKPKRQQNKTKDFVKPAVAMPAKRVMGGVCWADVAKGKVSSQHLHQQQEILLQTEQYRLQQEKLEERQKHPRCLEQQRQDISAHRQEVFTYEDDFPNLPEEEERASVCETDVSEAQSTSTASFSEEQQIDQIPDPVVESDIMGNLPVNQAHFDDNSENDIAYMHMQQLHHHQQQQQQQQQQQYPQHFQPPPPQFISPYPMMGQMPVPTQTWMCRYGLNPATRPPPGFQPRMMHPQMRPRVPQMHQPYGFRVNFSQGPAFPAPQMTMANIAQSLLQPYLVEDNAGGEKEHGEEREQIAGECRPQENKWNGSDNPVITEEDCLTVSPVFHNASENIWSAEQADNCFLETSERLNEAGAPEAWTNMLTKDTTTSIPEPVQQSVQQNDLSEKSPDLCRRDGFPGQECQQGLNEEDFGKIIAHIAKCLAASKSESVLFPETLRDEAEKTSATAAPAATAFPQNQEVFPGFHDMKSSVAGNESLNPFLLENMAKEQVKRQYRTIAGKPMLENSVYFHDFDYYASLYGLTTEELRDNAAQYANVNDIPVDDVVNNNAGQGDGISNPEEGLATMMNSATKRNEVSDHVIGHHTTCISLEKEDPEDKTVAEVQWAAQSRRWKDKLAQLIDLPYTMRKQMGRIVIPLNTDDFKISKSGESVVLGFLTDGCEVGVSILEAEREMVDKDLIKKLAASDTKYNFLLRYKALAEVGSKHYLATELCDYTLEEYIAITRLDHNHDPLAANRLAWQLLKGIRYLHDDIGIVHGNLRPDNIYVDSEGKLRVGGYGIIKKDKFGHFSTRPTGGNLCWQATETFAEDENSIPTTRSDVQVVGMILYYILTGGRHPYGNNNFEIELNLCQNCAELSFISEEANDLINDMLFSDVSARPSIDACLRHPFFWSEEKRFRMVLIAGSDVLKEMKTGIALTGSGSTTMTDFLNVSEYLVISDGWINVIDSSVLKEMRAFRQYKNTLAEMVLFIYNCCLHFDKMSHGARDVLDDPCRYFLARFPPLFMAVYKAIKASDRTDRTCYRPFF
ncbi:uncharacterized protein [Haliotis cracherodii]|uniref:uncharacterized protein n=1 Tax=Haliotis cracherodii TaxID=6455 RepID=UPI0039EA4741